MDNIYTSETINIAMTLYTYDTVCDVMRLVKNNGIDDILVLFADRQMYEHLECLEYLYL
jgi:hypothetical protein